MGHEYRPPQPPSHERSKRWHRMHETGVDHSIPASPRDLWSAPPNWFRYQLGSHAILLIITHDDAFGVDSQAEREFLYSPLSLRPEAQWGIQRTGAVPQPLAQHRIRGGYRAPFRRLGPGHNISPAGGAPCTIMGAWFCGSSSRRYRRVRVRETHDYPEGIPK